MILQTILLLIVCDRFVTAPTATGIGKIKKYNLNTHYTVDNVPDGLTIEIRDVGKEFIGDVPERRLRVLFTGKATAHAKANSVNNVTLTFLPAILQNTTDLSAVPTKTKNDIKIGFDEYLVSYTQKDSSRGNAFIERNSPVGRFSRNDTDGMQWVYTAGDAKFLDFSKDIIANPVLGTDFTVSSLPNGLSLRFEKDNDTNGINIAINGVANSHANSDDTTFTITINRSIFKNPPASNDEIIGRVQTFKLDFKD
uniref:Uncharacterized protein n=1 Tax=Stylophora pistillata TaxID=50429 RepID=A0A2B4RZ78_STYPI